MAETFQIFFFKRELQRRKIFRHVLDGTHGRDGDDILLLQQEGERDLRGGRVVFFAHFVHQRAWREIAERAPRFQHDVIGLAPWKQLRLAFADDEIVMYLFENQFVRRTGLCLLEAP